MMSKSDSPPNTRKEFNPSPHDRLVISGQTYQVMPHPAVPTFAFGQEGRKAFVYQISAGADSGLFALKKFKPAFRVSELVEVCDSLARFSKWPGLEVCERQCLHRGVHDDALDQFPDLEFAVLMPWISGSTWYDMIIRERPLRRLDALTVANAAAQVFSALEEAGLAHCDISAANVIFGYNPVTHGATFHLIDIEDLYAPGFSSPAALPAGTDGYAHKTASDGLWDSTADRFAGAVLIAEMAAWHEPEIRRKADEEHYFGLSEMQQDSPRYQLMRAVLEDHDPRLSELFDQAWFSATLDDCPRMKEWYEIINDVYHRERLAEVVSDWAPITVPSDMQDATPRPFVPPEPITMPEQPASKPGSEVEPTPDVARPEPTELPALPKSESVPIPPPSLPTTPPASRPIIAPSKDGPVREWRALDMSALSYSGGRREARKPVWDVTPISVKEVSPVREDAAIPIEVAETPPDQAITMEPDIAGEATVVVGEDDEELLPQPEVPLHEGEVEIEDEQLANQTPDSKFPEPTLDLSHVDRRRPFLVWTESYGASHYCLQEADTPDFRSPKEFVIKAKQTHWNPRRKRSGRLFYRVRAVAGDEGSPWSNVLRIQL